MTAAAARKPTGNAGFLDVRGSAIFAEVPAILAAERGEAITGGMRALLGNKLLGHDASWSES